MMRRKIRQTANALTLLLIASILTTCSDDSSSSRDDRGVFGDMADALQSVEADFLNGNAAIFASSDSMAPHIAAVLGLNTIVAASTSGTISCLLEGLGGRLYTFDGESYSGVAAPEVPDYTARFSLYELSGTGLPQTDQSIGYIDYSCVDLGVFVTEVQVYNNARLISSTTVSMGSQAISGKLRQELGNAKVEWLGVVGTSGEPILEFTIPNLARATYAISPPRDMLRDIRVNIATPEPDQERELDLYMKVGILDSVTGGHAEYGDTSSIRYHAACIDGGSIDSPEFRSPSGACQAGSADTVLNVNDSKLGAMSSSYESLRALWLRAARFVRICRSLVPDETK